MKNLAFLIPALLIAGCIIGDDFVIGGENEFSCDEDNDCVAGFVCKANVCAEDNSGPTLCPDADGDGYGVGEDRAECELCKQGAPLGCEEDPNDDPTMGGGNFYPGAPDICDSLDNDGDGTEDNFITTCTSVNDCTRGFTETLELPVGTRIVCENSACIVKMRNSQCAAGVDPCPCDANPLPCNNGEYPAVPAECQ